MKNLTVLTQNINGRINANYSKNEEFALIKLEEILEKLYEEERIRVDIISLTEVAKSVLKKLEEVKTLQLFNERYEIFTPLRCICKKGTCLSRNGTCILVREEIQKEYIFVNNETELFGKYLKVKHDEKGCDLREVRISSQSKNLEIVSCYVPTSNNIEAREGILCSIFNEMNSLGEERKIYLGDFNFFVKDPTSERNYKLKEHRRILNESYKNDNNYIDENLNASKKGKSIADIGYTHKNKKNNTVVDYIFTNLLVEKFINKDYMTEKNMYDHTTLVSIVKG